MATTKIASLPAAETRGEAMLLAAARAGTPANLAGLPAAQRLVRGALISALYTPGAEDGRLTFVGLNLSGAIISGPILLDSLGQSGTPAPALVLHECHPAAGAGIPLLMRGASFAAVDLAHTRLARLEARGLSCQSLVLTGLIIGTPDGRVDLEGAHLGAGSQLNGIGPAQEAQLPPLLNLAGARIAGSLNLAGSRLRALVLIGAAIEADLQLDGARLEAPGAEPAMLCNSARIGGTLRLVGTRVQGQLRLLGTALAGPLLLDNAQLNNPGGVALLADAARFGAGITLTNTTLVQGECRALHAEITGDVLLAKGARINQPNADALSLDESAISGGISLLGARLEGTLRLRGARVAGEVLLAEGTLINAPMGSAVVVAEATLGALRLSAATLHGQLDLTGATISGAVALESATLAASPLMLTALEASRLRAAQGLRLRDTTVAGQIRLDGAEIGDALVLLNLTVSPAPAAASAAALADPAGLLSLRGTRVADALRIRKLSLPAQAAVDLRGAQVGTLEDEGGAGWGRHARLRLDDFTYTRLAEPPRNKRAARRARLEFLLRQYPGGRPRAADFSGQPFTQLAQVLRATGHAEDADWFARARRRTRRAAGVSERPLGTWADNLVGFFFGDFYSPRRTLVTLALFLALGMGGLWAGNLQGTLRNAQADAEACWLTEELQTLAVADKHIPVPNAPAAWEMARMAVDLALPGIPLHWAERCEVADGALAWEWARRLYQWLGTALLLLAAAGLTGLFRRD